MTNLDKPKLLLPAHRHVDENARAILAVMTLEEKIGQLYQISGEIPHIEEGLRQALQLGHLSSVINETSVSTINEMQRIAVEESRLGIPLLIGRDVIHGFKTIFPIPLGQAATWSPDIIEQGARVAATEAAKCGINWTFAPMIDITRDPRWGRIAESLGEDPFLCSVLGSAMINGFQTNDLHNNTAIASCAKHFAGYGYTESGRDYSYANISENELRNVVLPPFHAAVKAGVASFMSSFSDLNGVPASANEWLMQDVLRQEWQFSGLVVSDWASISDLSVHGLTENDKESGIQALQAGIDIEMVSQCYRNHIPELLDEKRISIEQVNVLVSNVLRTKLRLGLFDHAYTDPDQFPKLVNQYNRDQALLAATKSCVLLKNEHQILPLSRYRLKNIAVLGPLADDPYEQLGTWIFDGNENDSVTCLRAIKEKVSETTQVNFVKALNTSRSMSTEHFAEALKAVENADAVIMVLGEESILSGEAHCRANIDLPGAQVELVKAIKTLDKPSVMVIMAGRPLTLENVVDDVDAILYAWHPGTMGGSAIANLIFGDAVPSGKLPVTFPRKVGQIPLYYAQRNSGRPVNEYNFVAQQDIPIRAKQTSLGMANNHLDTHYSPLYAFGYGLSYARFVYQNLVVHSPSISTKQNLKLSVNVSNVSHTTAEEVVQVYIRDLYGSITRPIKELKAFKRVLIKAESNIDVDFEISASSLGFYGRDNKFVIESGRFHLWVGGDSNASLFAQFEII
ncbi:glycoside hydrolase family 3 N-terminal domain-containing protein [Glaciecola petra]|uniref:beta-glucosidase n=1 Tax=Glaciecola petra TaxID=3075602 RepID=A0ABU2ZRQ7_9ALTE|nr:glycoside hydrolase family 3 N-terminal domain-containing protein [Aestuariibacter sp. P117]MDT0595321.1 glycoside hydrolase family 3 N-terminal domain-containing protein [Aestuariibacter sp. P117]